VSPPPRGSSSVQPLNIVKTLPPPPTETGAEPKKEQKNYTQLDLLRYDAPLTGAKITRMLNQLQFKLQVEEQYTLGSEKMAQAYRLQGDRRLLAETDAKRLESDGKIQLLRKAKRRYETLAKFGAVDDDDGEF
jgi:classical protein kinase C/novel protein kinase C epsilon type